jgi:hypothetical protein
MITSMEAQRKTGVGFGSTVTSSFGGLPVPWPATKGPSQHPKTDNTEGGTIPRC